MKKPSIVAFLTSQGIEVIPDGNRYVCKSPLKPRISGEEDKSPSFVIFPDGGFRDFSTGHWGDVWKLQRLMENTQDLSNLPEFTPRKVKKQTNWNGEIPNKYLDITEEERLMIVEYGKSRRITRGFIPGCGYRTDFSKRLALIFVHQIDGVISGAKFRFIDSRENERRFVVRGVSGFYILESEGTIGEKCMFLVESETSSNSLWEICCESNRPALILSHGSVEQIPASLPEFEGPRFLILDFDGNEKLYEQRVSKYSHLGLTPIRLNLGKSVDINSLYATNCHYQIEHLI
jgi:hypothetical protein